VPERPFSLREGGGWGAWELAFRYSDIDLDDHVVPGMAAAVTGGVFGGRQRSYVTGLNWYVNRNVRLMLNYVHADIEKLSATSTTRIGTSIDAIAARTQIAF
jgi:phosphate-selective porin OprO and OprP